METIESPSGPHCSAFKTSCVSCEPKPLSRIPWLSHLPLFLGVLEEHQVRQRPDRLAIADFDAAGHVEARQILPSAQSVTLSALPSPSVS